MIPAQLVKVAPCTPVSIAKGYNFYVLACFIACGRGKVVFYLVSEKRMSPCEHVYKQCLSARIQSNDSQRRVCGNYNVCRFFQSEFRHARHGFVYFYYIVHFVFLLFVG